MDGVRERLERKFQELLEETAGAAAELEALGRPAGGPVHYSQIEAAAHLAGQQLSRQVQQQASRELAAEQVPQAACPGCGKPCRLKPAQQTVESVDGPVELTEWKGHCPTCRRDFFPSA